MFFVCLSSHSVMWNPKPWVDFLKTSTLPIGNSARVHFCSVRNVVKQTTTSITQPLEVGHLLVVCVITFIMNDPIRNVVTRLLTSIYNILLTIMYSMLVIDFSYLQSATIKVVSQLANRSHAISVSGVPEDTSSFIWGCESRVFCGYLIIVCLLLFLFFVLPRVCISI